ncbi:hypothetical protein [Bradyrhizobium icense]|nr:hypothetical protein [Bradyrhizobium icense]
MGKAAPVSFALFSGTMRAAYQRMTRATDRLIGALLIVLWVKVVLDVS